MTSDLLVGEIHLYNLCLSQYHFILQCGKIFKKWYCTQNVQSLFLDTWHPWNKIYARFISNWRNSITKAPEPYIKHVCPGLHMCGIRGYTSMARFIQALVIPMAIIEQFSSLSYIFTNWQQVHKNIVKILLWLLILQFHNSVKINHPRK